jgi:hypothetical protein
MYSSPEGDGHHDLPAGKLQQIAGCNKAPDFGLGFVLKSQLESQMGTDHSNFRGLLAACFIRNYLWLWIK